jgi:hypothetical protein
VRRLLEILRFRGAFPAFDGDLTVLETGRDGELAFTWATAECSTTLLADFRTKAYRITTTEGGEERVRFSAEG